LDCCFQRIHSAAGPEVQAAATLHWQMADAKLFDYTTWLQKDVALHVGRHLQRDIVSALFPVRLRPGIAAIARALAAAGYFIVFLSGGLLCSNQVVAEALGVPLWASVANKLTLDAEQRVTGVAALSADRPGLDDKGTLIKEFAAIAGVALADCIAFGDSFNDTAAFRVVGRSVSVASSHKELRGLAGLVWDSEDPSPVFDYLRLPLQDDAAGA
jgi:phosphoserine phosphatase